MKNKKIFLYRVVADFIDIYTVTALLLYINFLVNDSIFKNYYFVILGYVFLIYKDFYNNKRFVWKENYETRNSFL